LYAIQHHCVKKTTSRPALNTDSNRFLQPISESHISNLAVSAFLCLPNSNPMAFQLPKLPLSPRHMTPQAGACQPTILSPQVIKTQLDSASQQALTQTSLLGHCLHQFTPAFASTATESTLHSAVIVCLDAEWYEHSPSHITELGISILLPDIVDTDPQNWTSAWKVARHLLNFHVRIKPNAHLVNG
jgi:hypothetical protein